MRLRAVFIWVALIVGAIGTVAGGIIEGRPVIALVYASLMIVGLFQWWRLRSAAIDPRTAAELDTLAAVLGILAVFGVAAPRLDAFGSWLDGEWKSKSGLGKSLDLD